MAPAICSEESEATREFDEEVKVGPCNAFCPGVAVTEFEVAVVGLGMIGSAAARHLALAVGGGGVVGIGPAEPPAWDVHPGPFASHYDQGRLARIADPDPVWAQLAARSMGRYAELERASGLRFHFAVGSIRVDDRVAELQAALHASLPFARSHLRLLTDLSVLRSSFPCFRFHDSESALVEGGDAGYINPRCMVAAQLALAEHHGAQLLRDSVRLIVPPSSGTTCGGGNCKVRIETQGGRVVWARKVLVCAGAYSGFLLPLNEDDIDHRHHHHHHRGRGRLDLRIHARTVLLAEVVESDEERLAAMPTFIWRLRGNELLSWVYGCPPTRYPDGRMMVKVGGTAWAAKDLSGSEAELSGWFQRSNEEAEAEAEALEKVVVEQVMPEVRIRSVTKKPCAVCFTAHGRPYIDAVDGGRSPSSARIFVAAGGCGAAAKSSDEIGRLAALLTWRGRWPCRELEQEQFRAVFK